MTNLAADAIVLGCWYVERGLVDEAPEGVSFATQTSR